MGSIDRISSGAVNSNPDADTLLASHSTHASMAQASAPAFVVKDTIDIAEETTDTQNKNVVVRVWDWISGWFTNKNKIENDTTLNSSKKIGGLDQNPTLEPPEERQNKSIRFFIDEMNHLIHRIKDMSEDTQMLLDFEKVLYALYLKQMDLKEEQAGLNQVEIVTKHQERTGHNTEVLDLMQNMIDRGNKSTVLTYVEYGAAAVGATMVVAGLVLGIIAATVATGGAALALIGPVTAGASAAAGIFGGGATVARGYFKRQDGNDSASLLELNEKMTTNDKVIKERMQSMKECIESMSSFSANLRRNMDSQLENNLEVIRLIK